MTDDEINRRVAEIEGWVESNQDLPAYLRTWTQAKPIGKRFHHGPPPYATDWAWCGPLLEKWRGCCSWDGMRWQAGYWYDLYSKHADGMADTPQRAICLAVIAAHGPDMPATAETWAGLGGK